MSERRDAGALKARPRPKVRPTGSYVEVEIQGNIVNLFERQGDGMSAAIVAALSAYGLRLKPRVSSPCG